MLIKKIFNDNFENFEIATICMENHASVTGWQNLFFPYKCFQVSAAFWDIRLKILRLPNFNMLFQLVLTKFFKSELFSCLPKVGHVIKSCKEPITSITDCSDCTLSAGSASALFFLGGETNYNRILGKINEWWNCCVWAMKAWSTYEVPSLPCLWTYIAL